MVICAAFATVVSTDHYTVSSVVLAIPDRCVFGVENCQPTGRMWPRVLPSSHCLAHDLGLKETTIGCLVQVKLQHGCSGREGQALLMCCPPPHAIVFENSQPSRHFFKPNCGTGIVVWRRSQLGTKGFLHPMRSLSLTHVHISHCSVSANRRLHSSLTAAVEDLGGDQTHTTGLEKFGDFFKA